MDQELKQRLIGAVVVTALAAIFIPMLFDDPIDDRSQQVSELAIPATPSAASTDATDKVPTEADQALKSDSPEEGYVEELNSSDEEPMQPIEGPDVDDESGFAEDVASTPKSKQAGQTKTKKSVVDEDVAFIDEADQESEAKIDADVEKLRPQSSVKSVEEATKFNQPNHIKAVTKPDNKTIIVEKAPVLKKVPTDAAVVKSKPIVKQKVEENKNLSVAAAKSTAPKDTAKKPTNITKPSIPKAKTEAKRWYIQVGSFGKKENALSLWESLRKDGFPVSLDTLQGEKGTLYRLKIGPELEAKRAADMKARLDKHNVNSILIAE